MRCGNGSRTGPEAGLAQLSRLECVEAAEQIADRSGFKILTNFV
ncbi:MAG: hypothetical protein AAGG01_09440 [Planctomycetota bacterium]